MNLKSLIKSKYGVLVGILIVLGGGLFVLAQPSDDELEPSEINSRIYYRMASAGISDAVVDVNDRRALVRYNIPENMTKQQSISIAMDAVASENISSSNLVLQIYQNFSPDEELTVSMEKLESFRDGNLNYTAFRDSWKRSELK